MSSNEVSSDLAPALEGEDLAMASNRLLVLTILSTIIVVVSGCVTKDVKQVKNDLIGSESEGRNTVIDIKIEKYQALSSEFPKEPRYRERLARLYWMKRDHTRALSYLSQARRLDPENPKYFYLEGTIYMGIQNYRLAEAAFKEIIDGEGSQFTGPYLQLAEISLLQEKELKAIEYLEQCQEWDPTFTTPHYYMGGIWLARRDEEKAIEHFEAYLKLGGGIYQDEVLQVLNRLQPSIRIHQIR